MRQPKNLDQYTDVETAAKGLEDFARDLRVNALEGDRVKWDLNVRMWNDAWIRRGHRVTGELVENLRDAKRAVTPAVSEAQK